MAWWRKYGLSTDPMLNAPVPKDSPGLLVRTKAIEDLEAYLETSGERGGVYLLNGQYGYGKTSILNVLGHLARGSGDPPAAFYFDVSTVEGVDAGEEEGARALSRFFKKEVLPAISEARERGARPVVGLDQLHNISDTITTSFFKKRQTAFEKMKSEGVVLVFAGDERFSDLAKTSGPLGAIFDRDFRIPPFEEEQARELLTRRMRSRQVDEEAPFPFLDDAIRELVKLSGGSPRVLVLEAGKVLEGAANQAPPIRITRHDVLAATAELTDSNLDLIRKKLRSPAIENSLHKLSQIHSREKGQEKIYDLGRLLDNALESPETPLEDHCENLENLKFKAEIIVKTADAAGLTESEQRTRKGRYGSITRQIHFLTNAAVQILADLKSETGLTPSQYLLKVAEDTRIRDAAPIGDAVRADLEEVRERCTNDRARNFLGRAIDCFPAIRSRELSGEDQIIQAVEWVIRGISVDLLGDVGGKIDNQAMELLKLSSWDEETRTQFGEHVRKWSELRDLYEKKGRSWTEENFEHARASSLEITRGLTRIFTVQYARRQEPSGPKTDDMDLSAMITSAQQSMDRLELQDRPTLDQLADQLPELVESALAQDAQPQDAEWLQRTLLDGLAFLDRLAYEAVDENTPAWLRGELAGVLDVLLGPTEPTEERLNIAIKEGASVFNHIAEQGPAVLKRAEGATQKLGSIVKERLGTKEGRAYFEEAEKKIANVAEKDQWNHFIRKLVGVLRSSPQGRVRRDAALSLWYFLRNVTSHTKTTLGLSTYRRDLGRALVPACTEVLLASLGRTPSQIERLVIAEQGFGPEVVEVRTRTGRELAISTLDIQPGDLCVAATIDHAGGEEPRVWRVLKIAEAGDIDASSNERFDELPRSTTVGLEAFKKRRDLLADSKLYAFRADWHSHGDYPMAFYGRAGGPAPRKLVFPSAPEQAERWLTDIGMAKSYFIGGIIVTGNGDVRIVPFFECRGPDHLKRLTETLGLDVDAHSLPPEDRHLFAASED